MMRPMFGTQAAYLDGKLMLCFSKRREPWNGILIATAPPFHEALRQEFPGVVRHPVLAKWLMLPDNAPRFEAVAGRLVAAVRRRDPRIGVVPPEKKRRR